jgi:hypothetical protein
MAIEEKVDSEVERIWALAWLGFEGVYCEIWSGYETRGAGDAVNPDHAAGFPMGRSGHRTSPVSHPIDRPKIGPD